MTPRLLRPFQSDSKVTQMWLKSESNVNPKWLKGDSCDAQVSTNPSITTSVLNALCYILLLSSIPPLLPSSSPRIPPSSPPPPLRPSRPPPAPPSPPLPYVGIFWVWTVYHHQHAGYVGELWSHLLSCLSPKAAPVRDKKTYHISHVLFLLTWLLIVGNI